MPRRTRHNLRECLLNGLILALLSYEQNRHPSSLAPEGLFNNPNVFVLDAQAGMQSRDISHTPQLFSAQSERHQLQDKSSIALVLHTFACWSSGPIAGSYILQTFPFVA